MSERAQFCLSHLSAIESEGITTKAYADREGLPVSALYQWRNRLVACGGSRRPKAGGGFVAMQLKPPAPTSSGCTVVIGAQFLLECATLPNVDWLAALAAALRARER